MNRLKILACVFIATAAYTGLSLTVGPRGLNSYNRMLLEKTHLEENLSLLNSITEDLEAQMKNLSSDPDTISIYAHELGFIREGEQLIRLAGFSGGIDRSFMPGSAIQANRPKYWSEWVCKLISLLTGIVIFFLFIIKERKQHDYHKSRY